MNAAEKIIYLNNLKARINATEKYVKDALVAVVPQLNEQLWNEMSARINDESLPMKERVMLSIGLCAADLARLTAEYDMAKATLSAENN